jgi:NADH:ubiquinone oxidoreductase subunit 3 (subunit A)
MKILTVLIITILFFAIIVASLIFNNLVNRSRKRNRNTSSYCATRGEGYACGCRTVENCHNKNITSHANTSSTPG